MSINIFYYSGTGNSLWIAKKIAKEFKDVHLISITNFNINNVNNDADYTGIVFPVYMWGVPAPVINFLDELKKIKNNYIFAAAVNGGQVSNTLVQLHKKMQEKGMNLNSGFDFKTPSNYIPWGGAIPQDKQKKLFNSALKKIKQIIPIIKERKNLPVEKGPLWQRILFSGFYKMSFNHVHGMDKKFWVDEKCNGCEICAKICPASNIEIKDGKPTWNQKCHQCLACIQWCPKESIQYGKKTPDYERYHHPEIKLNDMLTK